MDFQTDYAALTARLAAMWLPIFLVAAAIHWRLLARLRWRASGVAAAFAVGMGLTLVIMYAPVFSPSLRLKMITGFNAIGGLPVVAAVFSALVATCMLLAFMRLGPRPDSSSGTKPLGGSV